MKKQKDVYSLLWNEWAVYLPPLNNTNHRFISQIIFEDKKYLKWANVKICTILYYDKLRISDLVNFRRTQIDIDSYLPDSEYAKLPNRQWIFNVWIL